MIDRVTDVPVVGHPSRLHVKVPRYRCVNADCGPEVFVHNTDRLARRGRSGDPRYGVRRILRT